MTSSAGSARSRAIRSGVALLVGLFIAALAAEGVARWRYVHPAPSGSERRPAPRGLFQNHPAAGYALSPLYQHPEQPFSTNELGFRDRSRVPGAAPEGTVRVAVLGDSFTAGTGVGDEQHYPYLVEDVVASLRTDGSPGALELWNLGVPHYGIEQSSLQLLDRWDEVQPDVVVLNVFLGNDCWDDVQGPSMYRVIDGEIRRMGWSPWAASRYKARRAQLNRPRLAYGLPGDGLLQRFSYAYRMALGSVSLAREKQAEDWPWGMEPFDYEVFGGVAWLSLDPSPPPVREGWELSAELLDDLRREVEARGARLLLMDFPSRIRVEPGELAPALQRGWLTGERPGGGSRDGRRKFLPQLPEEKMRGIAQQLGLPLRELQQPLSEAAQTQPVHYVDNSHWTVVGHRVVAAELAGLLADNGLLDRELADAARAQLQLPLPIGEVKVYLDEPPGRTAGKSRVSRADLVYEVSDVIARMIEPSRLLSALPALPPGWTVASEPTFRIGPLPPPYAQVLVAQAGMVLRDPQGVEHDVLAVDSAGQPEFDHWWRALGERVVTGPVPDGMLPSTARLGVTVMSGTPRVLEYVDRSVLETLEQSLRPPVGKPPVHGILVMAEKVNARRFDPRRQDHLHDPRDLLAALAPPPAGWQVTESMPLYRDHGVPPQIGLPEELEDLLNEHRDQLTHHQPLWSAQAKRWYRGPEGSFALVIQDNGRNELLLRARQHRISRAEVSARWAKMLGAPDTARQPDILNSDADIRKWSFGGQTGYRTCTFSSGLCRVVVPLAEPGAPEAFLGRYTAILMGPVDAQDTAYGLLVSGIDRSRLP